MAASCRLDNMGTAMVRRQKTSSTPRTTGRLPATYKTLRLGLHGDSGNLYLQVSDGSNGKRRRSWIFRYTLKGHQRRDMGVLSENHIRTYW